MVNLTPEQLLKLKGINGVKNFSLVVEEKALLQNGDYQSVIYVKGVDENYRYTSGVADHLINGEYNIGNADVPKLILGAGVEDALGVYADRNLFKLNIYLPRRSNNAQLNMMEDISSDTINTSAAFLIQQDFDNKYGSTTVKFINRTLKLADKE